MEAVQNKVGAVLQGRYRILGFLGRGGMGTVYQCEDLRLPGKKWAVKEMHAYDPHAQDQVEESFKREAQILSRLRHRNLPMIVDYFIEESRQYLVMEYIEGENLYQLIQREGPASELQAMRWALELAQVLDYLHRQEKPVIFRDLKPDNTIITEDRHIKLVDFGLARQFDPGKRRDTQASGSVGYAPPEQWEDAAQTDERSDIYSLGATLFHVLTGRPPSPVYGSQRLRPYRPDLDPGAEAIVLKCLQPEPSQRYANSGELIRDLLLWLSKQPTAGTPPAEATVTSAEPEQGAPTQTMPAAGPPRSHLTSPWLLRFLQFTTLLFMAVASLGLMQFWAGRSEPLNTLVDPLQSILATTADSKRTARQLLAAGEYRKAIELLDKLITRYPEDAEAHILTQNAYILLQNKPHYKIPILTSTSGSERDGVQLYSGAALAQKQVNQSGGVNGHLLYLDLFDCASRQDRTIEIATQLASDTNYQIVLGPWTSNQVIAAAPIFNDRGMPALAPSASDPRVWELGRHIFTASESDTHRVERIASYFWQNGYRRVATLTAYDSIVSRSATAEFIDAFQKLGGEVRLQLTYSQSDPQFGQVLQSLEEGADAVFMAEYRTDLVMLFAHQFRQKFSKLPLATQAVSFSASILLNGGADVEGLLTSTYFHPDAPAQRIKEFTSQFNLMFGSLRPSHREANAYDSLQVIAAAIREVGFNREALTRYLSAIGDTRPAFAGVSGDFAPGRRLDRRKPYLVQIRNGQFQLLSEN